MNPESPIAMACLVLAAPCLPSRMWCISSRTNSPAWVLGDLPASLSPLARSITSRSGVRRSWINLNLTSLPDLLSGLQQVFDSHWQFTHAHPGSVIDGAGDRGRAPGQADLSDTSRSVFI